MKIVDATPEHAESFLSKRIRQHDIDEWVLGSGGKPVRKTLSHAFEDDDPKAVRRALLNDAGECICLWGATPHLGDTEEGIVWLIASEEAQSQWRFLHRAFEEETERLHTVAPFLYASTYAPNTLHHLWLERAGFTPMTRILLGGTIPFTIYMRHDEARPCVIQ